MAVPQIVSTRNGASSVTNYRDDLVAADLVGLSLSSYVGVTSVLWELVGRPEGSAAGGAGPEPIFLANANSAAFNVDSDAGSFRLDGTYIVQATINPGSPGQVRVTAALCRLSGLTIPGAGSSVRVLRKLGGFEALEDKSVPTILQGWATELNRWLELLRATVTGGAGGFTTLEGAYSHGASSSDQTLSLLDAVGGGVVIDGSGGGFTGASALKVLSAAGGPFVVDRATGRVGVGIAAPLQPVHVKGTAPAVRLDRTGGAALDLMNVGDELQFLNGALVLAKIEPTGGLQADLGVGIGTAPATAAVLALGAASTAPISASGQARFRYNEVTGHAEWSENGGAYQPFATPASAYQTIDANGTPLTQRTAFNVAPPLTAVDNSGATRTDVGLSFDSSLALSGSSLQRNALTGAVTAAAGSNATAFGAAAALSVLANATNASGIPAYLPAATAGQALMDLGTTLGWADPSTIGTRPALVFYIDNDSGNDANNGTTTTTPVKTFDLGIEPKVPSDGKGGTLTIHCLPRAGNANYLRSDSSNEAVTLLNRLANYATVTVEGDWFTTGSSPPFGGVPATGTNTAGYDVTGTPTATTWTVTLHGGGAPSLAAEPSLIGYLWRWDATTATASLRNVRNFIIANTSTSITGSIGAAAAPSAGDWGHIEMPGFSLGAQILVNGRVGLRNLNLFGINLPSINITSSTADVSIALVNTTGVIQGNGVHSLLISSVRALGVVLANGVQGSISIQDTRAQFIQVINGGVPQINRFYTNQINLVSSINLPPALNSGIETQAPMSIGDVPGATTNTPSRIVDLGSPPINGCITMTGSNARIGNVVFTAAQDSFPIEFNGQNNSVYIDGITGSGDLQGIIRLQGYTPVTVVNNAGPSKNNNITIGPNQTSLAHGLNTTVDFALSSVSPLDGLSEVFYSLMLDTLTYVGSVIDGNGNRITSYANNGLTTVKTTSMLWSPNVIPPLGPTVANDQGRFRVARASSTPGLIVLADASSTASASGIVGVNIDSLPDPVGTNADRYGSALIVSEGFVPIFCVDSSPTVPGPVYLHQSGSYPQGVVTTVKPSSGVVTQVGWASAVLANPFSETTQYPNPPNPNTITGSLLRVRLGEMGTFMAGDVGGTPQLNAFRSFTGLSVLARAAGSSGVPTELTATANNQVLQELAGALEFHALDYSQLTGTPTLFYQTVAEVGSSLTQRPILNFDGTVVATDSASPARTNVGLPSVGPGAGTIGTAGISTITLDVNGRVTAATTATYTVGGITSLTGDVTATGPGSVAATIAANAVTNAKFRQGGALSVVGVTGNATANVADISATAASGAVLRESGSTIGFGTIATAGLGNNVVTYAKIQQASASTLLGNPTGSLANVQEITLGTNLSFSGSVLNAAGGGSSFYQTIDNAGAALTQRGTWNASTGLTAVDNSGATRTDVTVNLSTGFSGGQSAIGDTGSGGNLTLSSTSNATKGKTIFGTTTLGYFDENLGALAIGGTAATTGQRLYLTNANTASGMAKANAIAVLDANVSGGNSILMFRVNGADCGGARVDFQGNFNWYASGPQAHQFYKSLAGNLAASIGGTGVYVGTGAGNVASHGEFEATGTLNTTALYLGSSTTQFVKKHGGQFTIETDDANAIVLATNATTALTLTSAQSVAVGTAALATTATDGFLYLSSMAGVPSGTPTALNSGASIPIVYDSTDKRLYIPNGASPVPLAQVTTGLATGFLKNTTTTGLWTVDTSTYLTQAYSTVQANASSLTQRNTLNFSADLPAVDNSGATRTDVSLLSVGTPGTYGGSGTFVRQIVTDSKGRVTSATASTGITPSATYKWSNAFVNSGTGLVAAAGAIVVPADTGNMQTTAGLITAGSGIPSAVAAAYGGINSATTYRTNTTYGAGGSFNPEITYALTTGTGAALTLSLQLWYATDLTNTGTYIQLATVNTTLTAGTSGGFILFSPVPFSTSVPAGAHLFLVAVRLDSVVTNVLVSFTWTAVAELSQ